MSKNMNIKNKRVLITGASKGLGKAASIAFADAGARLALVARSEDRLDNLVKSFDNPKLHLKFALDLLNSGNVKKLSDIVLNEWSGIDVIIHCVGGSLGIRSPLPEWEDFSTVFKFNIGISSMLNKIFVPVMKEQGSGNIIHVGSIVSSEARASVPYNTAKAALSGYVRSLGKELAEYGIIVSGILPGAFYGDGNAMYRFETGDPDKYKEFVKTLPQGRMPMANEYIPMLFLLSDPEAKVMSGSLVNMDGGQGQAYYNFFW